MQREVHEFALQGTYVLTWPRTREGRTFVFPTGPGGVGRVKEAKRRRLTREKKVLLPSLGSRNSKSKTENVKVLILDSQQSLSAEKRSCSAY